MNASIVLCGFCPEDLTLGAARQLERNEKIILHTQRSYLSSWLNEHLLEYSSLDFLYEEASDFDDHIGKAMHALESEGDCTFCVMDSSDETAKALLRKYPDTEVYGGSAFAGLELRSKGKFLTLDAVSALNTSVPSLCSILIKEIDSRLLAGDVKLLLEDTFGTDAEVYFRMPEGKIVSLPLNKLDRLKHYDHRCACLVNPAEHPRVCDYEALRLISESKEVKDACLDEEVLARKLVCVVQSARVAKERCLFTQQDLFERAADIIIKGEKP